MTLDDFFGFVIIEVTLFDFERLKFPLSKNKSDVSILEPHAEHPNFKLGDNLLLI